MERLNKLLGPDNAKWRKNSLCLSNMNEVEVSGNFIIGGHRELNYHITACDKAKRPTCKSREETAAFLKRSLIHVFSKKNVVIEDQFSSD